MFVLLGYHNKSLDGLQKEVLVGNEWSKVQEDSELGESDLGSPSELSVDGGLIEGLPHFDFVDCI